MINREHSVINSKNLMINTAEHLMINSKEIVLNAEHLSDTVLLSLKLNSSGQMISLKYERVCLIQLTKVIKKRYELFSYQVASNYYIVSNIISLSEGDEDFNCCIRFAVESQLFANFFKKKMRSVNCDLEGLLLCGPFNKFNDECCWRRAVQRTFA